MGEKRRLTPGEGAPKECSSWGRHGMASRVMAELSRWKALGCSGDTVLRGQYRTGSLDQNAAAGATQPSRARSGDNGCACTAEARGCWAKVWHLGAVGCTAGRILRDPYHPIIEG